MNIAFFLIPKKEVIHLSLDTTMRQALERIEYHQYTAVPVLDQEGRYFGTLTEGDLLWKLKKTPGLTFEGTNKILVRDIPQRIQNKTVSINSEMEDLLSLAAVQNFVPIVDDNDIFIGIIRRREIIDYCAKILLKNHETV